MLTQKHLILMEMVFQILMTIVPIIQIPYKWIPIHRLVATTAVMLVSVKATLMMIKIKMALIVHHL